MIDATKSPLPTWKRYGLFALVAALVVAAGAMIWTKELHHSMPGLSKSKPAGVGHGASPRRRRPRCQGVKVGGDHHSRRHPG